MLKTFIDTSMTDSAKNINIKQNAREGFLRCALAWEVEKRVRELFTSHDLYREAITEVFLDNYFSEKPADNIILQVPSFEAKTGVSFTITIPRIMFVHYSAMEWTTSFNEKTVPVDTPVLAQLENGGYEVLKCKEFRKGSPLWSTTNDVPFTYKKVVAFKACE